MIAYWDMSKLGIVRHSSRYLTENQNQYVMLTKKCILCLININALEL